MNDVSSYHNAAGSRTARSDFWRALSNVVGDEHADWICRLVSAYCWFRGISPEHVTAIRQVGR